MSMRLRAGLLALAGAGAAQAKTYVHLVPHTHDDVGWLKTVEEYQHGRNESRESNIQLADVVMILTNVVKELAKDKKRTFT